MTTPRVDPGRQCDGKVRHPDRRAARQARQRVGHRDAGGHLTIYRCPWCDTFHLGHAWSDPYLVDMVARDDRRELTTTELDAVAASVTARLLGITVAAARELLAPPSVQLTSPAGVAFWTTATATDIEEAPHG